MDVAKVDHIARQHKATRLERRSRHPARDRHRSSQRGRSTESPLREIETDVGFTALLQ